MASTLIDLDAVVPEDIGVILDGETYLLPGDIEGEEMAHLIRLSARSHELTEKGGKLTQKEQKELVRAAKEFGERFEGLFRVRQPELPEGFIAGMKSSQTQALIEAVFSYYMDIPIPEGGARPTGTKPRKPNSRRSPRRSSAKGRRAPASSTSSPT